VPHATSRLLVVALAGGVLLGALVASSVATGISSASSAPKVLHARSFDSAATPTFSRARLAQAMPSFRGGPTTASTGEIVDVRVSDSLPPEVTPEQWAEFIVGLVHGPEISKLTTYIATLDEVQGVCGDQALGCYSANEMVVPGEVVIDGTTPEEVVRHEYGHHIAFNRVNTPWVAVDWGPKYWASSANVCAKVTRQEAFPGDEGSNYARNPGEAWAEAYRLMDERKDGITTGTWPIIAPSFYPTDDALLAAERDVVEPWTASQTALYKRTFTKKSKKVWILPLSTPLDGELRIAATLPAGGEYDVALVSDNRRTVLKRAQWVSQRVKRLSTTVCGQRSLAVRVTRIGKPGRARVSVTTP
jgi:hypothetical protein